MPRKPRLHVPGGIYHVILRGNNRQPVFFTTTDRLDLEALFSSGVARYECRVHGYCWMTNHVHLAVQTGRYPVGRFVQWAVAQYARRLNRRQNRCGHVFEKRHRAILVEEESYLLSLIRYIHRNPVVARITERAGAYRWSSHESYMGQRSKIWLTTDLVLSHFSPRLITARRMFDEYVHDESDAAESTDAFERGGDTDRRVIGNNEFLERMLAGAVPPTEVSGLDDIVLAVCRTHDVRESQLLAQGRDRRFARIRAEIAKRAIEAKAATLAEVARRFGRSDAVICRSIRRYFPNGIAWPK